MSVPIRWWLAVACVAAAAGAPAGWSGEDLEAEAANPAAAVELRADGAGGAAVEAWLRLDPPGAPSRVSRERLLGLVQLALGQPLVEPAVTMNEAYLIMRGRIHGWASRDGLTMSGRVRVRPLQTLLRDAGQARLALRVTHPRLGRTDYRGPAPYSRTYGGEAYFQILVTAAGTPAEDAVFAWGFDRFALAWRLVLPLLAVLVPVLFIAGMRRRSLRLAERDATAAWFGFWRAYWWMLAGSWLAWLWLIHAARWVDLMEFAGGAGHPARLLALALPPALAGVAAFMLSRPVFERVRGIHLTPAEMVRQEFWRQAAFLAPAALGLVGLRGLFDDSPLAWLFFGLALLAALVGMTGYAWATGMMPHQLMAGELRDRIVALAAQAGVTLRRIFVMPAGRLQIGNAFAVRGNDVILTDYLLERLTRAETDAVIAHELGHLKNRHHRLAAWGGFVLVFAVLFAGGSVALTVAGTLWDLAGRATGIMSSESMATARSLLEEFLYPLCFLTALWAQLFVNRRCERSADRFAVTLTGDPESAITALVKLSRMNLVPVRWGFWDEQFGTHPDAWRRIQAIAAAHAVPPERLEELLKAQPGAAAGGYPVPEEMRNPQRLFTPEFKSRQVILNLLMMAGVLAATPPLWYLRLGQIGWGGPARWTALAAGPLVVLAVYLVASNFTQLSGYGAVRRQLAGRLRRQGLLTGAAEGEFVGWAPEAQHRVYEGHSVWDVGFVIPGADGLAYAGDRMRFRIPRDAVTAVETSCGPPGLLRTEEVRLRWRGPDGRERTWRLAALGGASRLGNFARSRRLRVRLERWRSEGGVAEPDGLAVAEAPLPELDDVRGDHPRKLVQAGGVVFTLMVIGLLSLGVSAVAGADGAAMLYGVAVSSAAYLLALLPLALYRDTP